MKTDNQRSFQFDIFFWIDICRPNKENLNKIAKEYQLDYFQIKDSNRSTWIYQNKLWYGLAFGLNIN